MNKRVQDNLIRMERDEWLAYEKAYQLEWQGRGTKEDTDLHQYLWNLVFMELEIMGIAGYQTGQV